MNTFTIKQVTDEFKIPASTLRYYEDMKLLTNVGRNNNGQRIYKQEHIDRLGAIACLKRTGMTISQLQSFFMYEENIPVHVDDILNLLKYQEALVAEQIDQLQMDYAHIKHKLAYYGGIKESIINGNKFPNWEDYEE